MQQGDQPTDWDPKDPKGKKSPEKKMSQIDEKRRPKSRQREESKDPKHSREDSTRLGLQSPAFDEKQGLLGKVEHGFDEKRKRSATSSDRAKLPTSDKFGPTQQKLYADNPYQEDIDPLDEIELQEAEEAKKKKEEGEGNVTGESDTDPDEEEDDDDNEEQEA